MHLTGKLSELTRNLYLEISSRLQAQPMTVLYRVPYTSQFASPEYAEKVLLKNIPASFDPIWLETGATSAEEYVTWVTTICGMACTVMALEYFKQTKHQTISLARDAFSHHVYQLHRKELSGLRYKEYCSWVAAYKLQAAVYSRLSITGVRQLLAEGKLVIASVNPNIRGIATMPKEQIGGHLVLVVGYDKMNDTLTIHNPSGFTSNESHRFHTVSTKYFNSYFAQRGISLITSM